MHRVLKLQKKLARFPLGASIFSMMVARAAPYFTTIRPKIVELRTNYCKATMRNRRSVQNHIKTVHAIAMCNLCEFVAGLCIEVSIPKHRRWIPQGMEVAYIKKAKTDLTASCDLSAIDWDNCDKVLCPVEVRDTNGEVVVSATINMKVSDKPKNKAMLHFKRSDSEHADFIALVKALDADLKIRDGVEHGFYAQFNKIDQIKHAIVAYEDNVAVACGAMKQFSEDTVEIKRMYTIPSARGRGLATKILTELECWAVDLSYKKCVLETGKKQPEAIQLYLKNNYNIIPNYGQYQGVDNSVCFEKILF